MGSVPRPTVAPSPSPHVVGVLVALSGFCSLVYQVAWDRILKSNFGGDTTSSAIVTGTFLLGLGIGALLFGRWQTRPFRTYALVEAGIGLYALASYPLLASLATLLGSLFDYTIADVEGLRLLVVVGCVLFLLPPCILMGGTLPLMFNCFIRSSHYENKTVGLIYGLNTAGACLGILAVPFLFLNHLSIPATLGVVGTLNVLLGLAVWSYGRVLAPLDEPPLAAALTRTDKRLPLPPLLGLAFVSGFLTLSFEVSLFRTVGVMTKSSPYSFTLVLMPFLLALALGSMLFTRFAAYSLSAALRRVGLLFILAMLGMLVGPPLRAWLIATYNPTLLLLMLLLWVLPMPFLAGGIFPLLLRLAAGTGQELPAVTGRMYLLNSVGSFLGAMLSQFYAFPLLGTRGLLTLLFWLGLGVGIACLLWAAARAAPAALPRAWPRLALPLAALALLPLLLPRAMWDIYVFEYTGPQADRVEGVSGVATIYWEAGTDLGHIQVNGTYQSALPDHPKHVRLESVALAMPQRAQVLVLGLGGGGMIRELVADPGIKQIDIVDWSRELPLVLQSERARAALAGALESPKVRIYRTDARVAVSLYEAGSFDMVVDNLTVVGWVGSTNVKSLAYFQEIRRILKPEGVFVFDPNYHDSPAREAVLAGLVESFPHIQEHPQAVVVLASAQPLRIDPQRAEEVLATRGELLGLAPPYADWLLKGFQPITAASLNDTPPIRDDLLIYEYTYFRSSQ